jgi:hypothetical protein
MSMSAIILPSLAAPNNHGSLPVAPFVSMLRASFVHGFRSGPSASHVEDNQTEKERPMKTYTILEEDETWDWQQEKVIRRTRGSAPDQA